MGDRLTLMADLVERAEELERQADAEEARGLTTAARFSREMAKTFHADAAARWNKEAARGALRHTGPVPAGEATTVVLIAEE